MTGMLIVAADKLCDPIVEFILMKANNGLLHGLTHNRLFDTANRIF